MSDVAKSLLKTGAALKGLPGFARAANRKHYSAITGDGFSLEVDRLPNGKWMLKVNGVEMHFNQRPEFTIPQK